MVFLRMTHSCQSNVLNCCTLDIFCVLHIVLLVIHTTVYRMYLCSGCFFQFYKNLYRLNGTSLLKALFLIWLKGVNFCGVLFCGFFILRELIFADRGQSAKSAKIRTRKIFMLHGTYSIATISMRFSMRFSQDTAAARRNLNVTISSALKVTRNATAIGIVWTDLMRTTANV